MRVLMLAPDAAMIDRRILQEASVLRGQGHDVTVIAGFECEREQQFEQGGIAIHRFAYDPGGKKSASVTKRLGDGVWFPGLVNRLFVWFVRPLIRLTPFEKFIVDKARSFQADIVHAHDFPMLLPGLTLANEWDARFVYDAHEIYWAQESLPPALRQRCRLEERRLIGRSDAVITVNDFIAERMAKLYGIKKPTVLHNSIDPPPHELVERQDGPLRQRIGGNGPIVLFQGWLSAERNIETLVRAMVHVPAPATLAVIGYGPFEGELRRIAQTAGVGERVHFLGAVPSEQILRYTVDASLGAIPYQPIDENHRLCSPNKFFEYVMSGVPVIAHDLPFFQKMAAQYGVVDCVDLSTPESTGAAIRGMLDGERAARMRERCLEAAPQLAWDVESRQLVELYERFV